MKTLYLRLLYFLISVNSLQANIDINDIKDDMYHEIVDVRNKYLTIKNNLLSPFNKANLSYDYCLDSLKFLSERLEIKRQAMFTLIKDIDLAYDDICLIDELNSNSILLHNIINSFGGVYHSYLFLINPPFSFDEYIAGMEALFQLEKNIPYLDDN